MKQSENLTHAYKLIYKISALSFNNCVSLRWKSQHIFQMVNGNVKYFAKFSNIYLKSTPQICISIFIHISSCIQLLHSFHTQKLISL